MAALQHIVDQHAEEAAFLWLLRDRAVHAPHYALRHLARLDERIEAHLDGLRVAGDAGWETARAALHEHKEPGEVFAAGVLALDAQRWTRLEEVIEIAGATAELVRPLVSAFGWTDSEKLRGVIARLLAAASPLLRQVGLAACGVHRGDPGAALETALRDPEASVRARALRTAGELGRDDLAPAVRAQTRDDDPGCAFWASWSATLLGERVLTEALMNAVHDPASPHHGRALDLVLRSTTLGVANEILSQISSRPELRRSVIVGAASVGDPAYAPWLIEMMREPLLARVAGESFELITGADLAYEDLEGEPPADFAAGPSEDPEDTDVAMDPDEHLPWPDPAKVRERWAAIQARLPPRTRHLLGGRVTAQHCAVVLREARQRQRRAAALELVLAGARRGLFEIRAPAPRQLGSAMRPQPGGSTAAA